MTLRSYVAFALSFSVVALACSGSSNDSPGGSSGSSGAASGGATGAQIDACKQGCDKMKFFNCSSAAEQARCYDDCDKASSKQIEVFTGCAQASVCDPDCRTSITPAPSTGGTGGSGASAESCGTACQKLVTCNFIKVGDKDACVDACEKQAYQYQIDCVTSNDCSAIPKACGASAGGSGGTSSGTSSGGTTDPGVFRCESACDGALFFKCIDASQQAKCREACTTVAATKRDAYASCANQAGGDCAQQGDCYSQLTQ